MKRLPNWAVGISIVCVAVAGLAAIHRWLPTGTSTTIPYDRVVAELHELYPIYMVKHLRSGNVWEMDGPAMAQAREHPAYAGEDPCWDLDVTYTDLTPGTEHEIEIVNGEKLSERKTFIRIRRQNAGRTEVSISSTDTDFLFNQTTRAFFYERQRLWEIEHQLQRRPSAPNA